MTLDYLGAHMSIAGGLYRAAERGREAGCGVIQVFTQNTNQWRGKMPTDSDVRIFREKRAEGGFNDVVSHDIYLINLAAPEGEIREKSLEGFLSEMERCARFGIDKIVMHPGSHLGAGETEGIRRICEAFDCLIERATDYRGKILLELTAGQGTNLGHTFEQIRAIIDGTSFPDRFGVCYDTCHTLAAGYDITTPEAYEATMAAFDRIIGLDRLMAFHINDSKKGLHSRVDRHEHIGHGCLGLEPFRLIMNDSRFAKVPKIIETPKGDNNEMDAINLGILRALVGKGPGEYPELLPLQSDQPDLPEAD